MMILFRVGMSSERINLVAAPGMSAAWYVFSQCGYALCTRYSRAQVTRIEQDMQWTSRSRALVDGLCKEDALPLGGRIDTMYVDKMRGRQMRACIYSAMAL